MAIDKPRGSKFWRIRFTTPNGKRIQCTSGTTEKREAQELHDKLKAQYWRKEKLNEKPKRTWGDAILRWKKEQAHKKTFKDDNDKILWLNKYFGNMLLEKIDRDFIEFIANEKAKPKIFELKGGNKKEIPITPTTVNRTLEFIRAVLRKCKHEWGWLDDVPAVRMLPTDNKRIRFLTHEEAARLIKELPPHLADMASFSLATGLRKANVTGLKWSEVNLVKKHALVHPDQSKNNKAIPVPLNADAMDILRKQIGKHSEYVFTYAKLIGKVDNKEIFELVPVRQVNTKAWANALDRAGIKNFRWHDLRHTWASWHVQNGTSLHELQQLGGWTSYEMVQRYAHLSSDQLKNAAERISGLKSVQPVLKVVGKDG